MKISCEFCGHTIDVKEDGCCENCGASYANHPDYTTWLKQQLQQHKSYHKNIQNKVDVDSTVKQIVGVLAKGLMARILISVIAGSIMFTIFFGIFIFVAVTEDFNQEIQYELPEHITALNEWEYYEDYAVRINHINMLPNKKMSVEYSIKNTDKYSNLYLNKITCWINGTQVEMTYHSSRSEQYIKPGKMNTYFVSFEWTMDEVETIVFIYDDVALRFE